MFTELTEDQFEATLAACQNGIFLFVKPLCPNCRAVEKMLEKFAAKVSGLSYYTTNMEQSPQAFKKYEALRVPTMLVVKNGSVTNRHVGLLNPIEMQKVYSTVRQVAP